MATSQAFQKNRRLLRRAEYEAVFKASRSTSQGSSFRKGPFVLYWKKTENPARLGLSIPRRVIKSAVKRNRVKRCAREYFRRLSQECRGDYILRLIHSPGSLASSELVIHLQLLTQRVEKKCG